MSFETVIDRPAVRIFCLDTLSTTSRYDRDRNRKDISDVTPNKHYEAAISYYPEYDMSYCQFLRSDIVSLLRFIQQETKAWRRVITAANKLSKTMAVADFDKLLSVKHRLNETLLILKQQSKHAMRYNNSYNNHKANTVQHIVRPEHFTRHMKIISSKYPHQQRSSELSWDGTEYKYQLVCSLRDKLLKKLVIMAFAYYVQCKKNSYAVANSCDRNRSKKLLLVCFNSLVYNCLSSQYITINSNNMAINYIKESRVSPILQQLRKYSLQRMAYKNMNVQAVRSHHLYKLRRSFGVIITVSTTRKKFRYLRKYISYSTNRFRLVTTFFAWCCCIMLKAKVRIELNERLFNRESADSMALHQKIVHFLTENNLQFSTNLTENSSSGANGQRRQLTFYNHSNRQVTADLKYLLDMKKIDLADIHSLIEKSSSNLPNNTTVIVRETIEFLKAISESSLTIRHVNAASIAREIDQESNDSSLGDRDKSIRSTISKSGNSHESIHSHESFSPKFSAKSRETEDRFTTSNRLNTSKSTSYLVDKSRGVNVSTDGNSHIIYKRNNSRKGDHAYDDQGIPSNSSKSKRQSLVEKAMDLSSMLSSTSLPCWSGKQNSQDRIPSKNSVQEEMMYKSIVAPSNNRFSNIGTLMSDDESSLSSGSVKRPSNYKSMYLTKDLHNNTRSLNQYSELSSKRRYPESLNNSPQASVKSLSEEEHSLVRFSKINDNSDFEDSPEMLHAYRLQTMIDFQALKFQWLIRQCRKFVRILHRTARLRKVYFLISSFKRKEKLQSFFSIKWKHALNKRFIQAQLIDDLYGIKLLTKVFRAWVKQSITRLDNATDNIGEVVSKIRGRTIWKMWRCQYIQRKYLHSICSRMRVFCMKQVLQSWKSYLLAQNRLLGVYENANKRLLKPFFRLWEEKFYNRQLLKRVFVRREEAIVYHTYHKALAGTPQHSYYLLLKIIKSWSFYTKKLKEDKQTEQFRVSSLMFRRASLLSRALYDWSDAVKMIKLKRLREKKRGKIVFRLCFSSWKDSVNHVKNDCIHHYNNYCSNLLSRVWRYWKKYHVKTSVEMPSEYYSFLIRRKFFKFWRTIKARIIIRKDILPILSKTMLRSAFAEWSSLLQRTRRYRQGMKLLESLYYKCKMIVAFRQWPGRRQWQLSEELKQNYDTRGRGKIRLVDYDHAEEKEKKSALSKEYRKKSIEESNRSYLLSKRNNLEQRALKHGFINDLNDRFQVGNIRELGLAVLTAWKKASAYKRNLHYKQWKVRALINSKTELLALRHWMAVTPMTTYRVVTWMSKRYRRAHDLYLYDKALTVRPLLPGDEEYEEEMKNQLDYEALYKAGRDRFQQKRYGGSTFLDKAVAVIEHYSDEN